MDECKATFKRLEKTEIDMEESNTENKQKDFNVPGHGSLTKKKNSWYLLSFLLGNPALNVFSFIYS